MIKLSITKIPFGEDRLPENIITASMERVPADQAGMLTDDPQLKNSHFLNVFLPESKLDEIQKSSREGDCIVHVNILTYADNNSSVVTNESVKAISELTKKQFEVLGDLLTGKTYENIADQHCRAFDTIRRHAQDIYSKTGLNKRCLLLCAFLRFIMENPCFKFKDCSPEYRSPSVVIGEHK